ncbi:hypothetical protein BDV24DRAFT_58624 [Aspergillus arachidicola]|uniref:Secreted protein n=1 Tax=Aspergillus arachidicola TaxID=656916 RepID=A0A5N6Y5Z4_9EURO|nr:hypothetical protein BDV24DRAFT_58624 [Aspergillus arachidicola]
MFVSFFFLFGVYSVFSLSLSFLARDSDVGDSYQVHVVCSYLSTTSSKYSGVIAIARITSEVMVSSFSPSSICHATRWTIARYAHTKDCHMETPGPIPFYYTTVMCIWIFSRH